MPVTDLSAMRAGQSGTVIRLDGGAGVVRKLENIGIRTGVRVTKVSSQIMRGPVVVRIGGTRLAIGHGMARRVIVGAD